MASVEDDTHNAYDDVAWLEKSRADIARRYAGARRHSLAVRILRIALPVVSIVGVIAFVVIAYVLPELPAGISASSIDVTHNTIVMKDPHVSGFLRGGRTYEVRADRAEQSLENTKVATLDNIVATLGFGNGESAQIVAPHGTYFADKQRIVLSDDIVIKSSNGASGTLQSADIDIPSGTMVSDKPMRFESAGSSISAAGIHVFDKGGHIVFTGPVKVRYSVPADSKPSPEQPPR